MAARERLLIQRSAVLVASIGLLAFALVTLNTSQGSPSEDRNLPARDVRPSESHRNNTSASNGAIAFVRYEKRDYHHGLSIVSDIFVLEEGTPKKVVRETPHRSPPAWSPDGTKLAFSGNGIHVADAIQDKTWKVASCSNACDGIGDPAWSPDGQELAFVRSGDKGRGIWAANVDSGALTLVREDNSIIGSPTWSSDGRTIAAIADVEGTPRHRIALINRSDGSISFLGIPDRIELGETVAFSPDGESLAVDSINDGEGIHIIDAATGGARLLTSCRRQCIDFYPTWSPDGRKVLFTRSTDVPGSDGFVGDLYVMSAAGGPARRITSGPSLDCCASWQPLPRGANSIEHVASGLRHYGDPRVPRPCREKRPLRGHVDSDNKRDFVYHHYFKRMGAGLGVCTGSGRHDRIHGLGQSELLALIDVESDGRHEIFFGGTTMRAQIYDVAVFHKGRLARVKTDEGPLRVVDGIDEGVVKNRRPTGAAFSCENTVGDGEKELVQAGVFRKEGSFRWVKFSYQLEGLVANQVAKDSGSFTNDPNKQDIDEVVSLANRLVGSCKVYKE